MEKLSKNIFTKNKTIKKKYLCQIKCGRYIYKPEKIQNLEEMNILVVSYVSLGSYLIQINQWTYKS